jgi:hypothetical protein
MLQSQSLTVNLLDEKEIVNLYPDKNISGYQKKDNCFLNSHEENRYIFKTFEIELSKIQKNNTKKSRNEPDKRQGKFYNKKFKRWEIIDSGEIYTAAGVLFYTDKDVLYQTTKRGMETFGGKIDTSDRDILDTACREAAEETNGMLYTNHSDDIEKRIKISQQNIRQEIERQKLSIIKFPDIKYVLFQCKISKNTYRKIKDSKIFGKNELHSDIDRSVLWIKINELSDLLNSKKGNIGFLFEKKKFISLIKSIK